MINETRLLENFIKLSKPDSESFHERQIGEMLKAELEALGLSVRTDTTDPHYLKEHPESCPNLYGFLKGNLPGTPILFSAHMDTVAPGKGKAAMLTKEDRFVSEGETVLGADDIAGLTSILEALAAIREEGIPHRDIEVLFTAAEEPFCEGSRFLNYEILKAKNGYVLDLNGDVGAASLSAPSILSFTITIKGRAAHAGFSPESGINALNIAVQALATQKTGHVDDETTLNFGTIHGGTGKNIVPGEVVLEGEIRSSDHEKALRLMEQVERAFTECARKAGGVAYCCSREHIRAYRIPENEECVKRFEKAAKSIGIEEPVLTATFGGSDANRLNAHGIQTIVLSCGMEEVHTTSEYIKREELLKSASLTYRLMTLEEEIEDEK